MVKYITCFVLLLVFGCKTGTEPVAPLNIIPLPNEITEGKGNLVIKKSIFVHSDNPDLQRIAELFRQQMKEEVLVTLTDNENADIQLVLSPEYKPDQSYSLDITRKQATLTANTSQGIFYGFTDTKSTHPFWGKCKQHFLTASGKDKRFTTFWLAGNYVRRIASFFWKRKGETNS